MPDAWSADCGHRLSRPGDAEHVAGRRLCPRCGRSARRRLLEAAAAARAAGQQDIDALVELPPAGPGALGGLFDP